MSDDEKNRNLARLVEEQNRLRHHVVHLETRILEIALLLEGAARYLRFPIEHPSSLGPAFSGPVEPVWSNILTGQQMQEMVSDFTRAIERRKVVLKHLKNLGLPVEA